MTDQNSENGDLENLLEEIKIRMNILRDPQKKNQITKEEDNESLNPNESINPFCEEETEDIESEGISTVGQATESGVPIYGAKINPYKSVWEISNPISLTKTKNTKGICLKRGFYKIEYEVNIKENSYSGLGIFDPKNYKIKTIIAWYFCDKGQCKHINGSKYYKVEEEVILGITNSEGKHKPEAQIGTAFLTIHKLAKANLL